MLDFKKKRDRSNLSEIQLDRCFEFIDTFINYLQSISYDYMKISSINQATMMMMTDNKIMIPGSDDDDDNDDDEDDDDDDDDNYDSDYGVGDGGDE